MVPVRDWRGRKFVGKIKLDYGIRWEYIIEDECVRSQCVTLSITEYIKEGVEIEVSCLLHARIKFSFLLDYKIKWEYKGI